MTVLRPIAEVLPHREPFIMIDEVVSVDIPTRTIVAARTFRADEPFFKGHFPGNPVVPGVLLIEGLAQTMAYLARTEKSYENMLLVGIDNTRFRDAVYPGQRVEFTLTLGEERFGLHEGKGRITVAGKRVAEATLKGFARPPT